MLKLISLKLTVRATCTAPKLQISFCQDSRQNVGERPYVYKQNRIQIQVHGCWLKQLVTPNFNNISLVHVAISEINTTIRFHITAVRNRKRSKCSSRAVFGGGENKRGRAAAVRCIQQLVKLPRRCGSSLLAAPLAIDSLAADVVAGFTIIRFMAKTGGVDIPP